MKIRHFAGAVVLFVGLISIAAGIYEGMERGYGITPQDTEGGMSIIEKLNSLNLLEGINDISNAIERLKDVKITDGFDILGSLAAAATGILKVVGELSRSQ